MAENVNDHDETLFVVGRKTKAEKSKGKEKPKSKKSKNWSPEETSWLIDQIAKRRNIIESKATNRGFKELNMKNSAWLDIAKAFNNKVIFTPRPVDRIKAKWDNLKTECKKKADAQKKHLNQTGAAPNSKLALSTQEERVMDIMNVVKSSLDNPYDADSGCSTISYSSAPAEEGSGSDDGVAETTYDVPEYGDEEDRAENGDAGGNDDGNEIIDISTPPKLHKRKGSFVTPTPAKIRKISRTTTREDLDAAQMEIWELQRQHMIEKHQAYMDTLDLIRTVVQQQSVQQTTEQAMGYLHNLQQIDDVDQI